MATFEQMMATFGREQDTWGDVMSGREVPTTVEDLRWLLARVEDKAGEIERLRRLARHYHQVSGDDQALAKAEALLLKMHAEFVPHACVCCLVDSTAKPPGNWTMTLRREWLCPDCSRFIAGHVRHEIGVACSSNDGVRIKFVALEDGVRAAIDGMDVEDPASAQQTYNRLDDLLKQANEID